MEVLACGVNLHLALKQRWHRKEKKLHRGITDCWKTGTPTTLVQDIDTGGRATLPVPGAVLEPPVPEASGSEECKMATEGSNLHDDGGGRTDNRPAYSCHSRQKAGSILEEEPRRAAGGTTNRSHPATAAACSLSKASGVQPVATKMLSVASDTVHR